MIESEESCDEVPSNTLLPLRLETPRSARSVRSTNTTTTAVTGGTTLRSTRVSNRDVLESPNLIQLQSTIPNANIAQASLPQLLLFLLSNQQNSGNSLTPIQQPIPQQLPQQQQQQQNQQQQQQQQQTQASSSNATSQPQANNDKTLTTSLEYLNKIKEPAKILEDEQAISALISTNEIYRKNRDQISNILESKIQFILKDLFVFIYEHLNKYVLDKQYNIEVENNDSRFTAFHLIVDLTEILVVSSREFSSKFHMTGGTKCLLTYIGNEKLMEFLTKSCTDLDPFKKDRKMNYCKALSSILNILFHLKTGYYQSFKELNAIETITKFTNNLKYRNCELILRSHFILAGICTRKQMESLKNIGFSILILEKTLQMFAQACQKKTKYTSYEFDFFFDNEVRTFEINTNGYPNTFMVQISFITEAFLVNDEIKYRIFETIKNSLLILLIQGDQLEKYVALNLLNNFAFDDVLCEKLSQNMNFLASTSQILNSNEKTEELLKSVATCFKTLLNMKQMCTSYNQAKARQQMTPSGTSAAASGNRSENDADKFVFLSSHDSNELISIRIKNELENRGFNVVMSERRSGRSYDMDKITKSIEASSCMVVCLSSSYQCEQLCQLEAHYANKLHKTIIPCLVQTNYEADYWTETLMHGKRSLKARLPTINSDMNALTKEIMSKAKLKPKFSNSAVTSERSSRTCTIL